MHRRGRIYWLTWALLVLGAAATGVASIQDAFFRGAIAAFLAALALPLYERAGPRGAAFLGVLTGVIWQLGLTHGYGAIAWDDTLRAYARSRLEIDLSVAAAAFAGAALAAALVQRTQRFVQAAALGATLALAMTALPYGFIRSSETARLGPVEVTWLAPATVLEESGRPWRPKGTKPPALSADDIACLRQGFLTVEIDGENAVVDTQGRRLWAVWRHRLTYPGHEDGPVRRVFIASTRSICIPFVLALPEDPEEACAIELTGDGAKVVAGRALVADPGGLIYFEYTGLFDRLVDSFLRRGKNQPVGLHAPALLCLEPISEPRLWCVRRNALETAGEALKRSLESADREAERSDLFSGFTLIMPEPPKPRKPGAAAVAVPEIEAAQPSQQPVGR